MADARFFGVANFLTLGELAGLTGARLDEGADASKRIEGPAPLGQAGAEHVSFLDNAKYVEAFAGSRAGACFVRDSFAARAPKGMALLLADDPYRAFALAARAFYPDPPVTPGVAAQAAIDATAEIHAKARIEPFAVIGAGARIGARTLIGVGTVIGRGVEIGEDCRIGAQGAISHALIGDRVIVHPGVRIGQDGFGFAMGRGGHLKVPQLGRVIVGDDVEIGANTCIDRGAGPDTVIGAGTKIDNLVQIGHNVQIGRHAVIVAQVGIAGSTRIGDGVVLGGQVGVSGHLTVGAGARAAAQSGIAKDVPPGETVGGYPAVPVLEWHRQTVAIARLIRKDKR